MELLSMDHWDVFYSDNSELKRAKDKLDLGLITQEEFNSKRLKLAKYIK